MVNFTTEQLRRLLSHPRRVRNLSVIAHVDHGKSTLSDSLLAKAGIIAKRAQGDACHMDTMALEQLKGITIKSTAVSLYYERNEEISADEKEREGKGQEERRGYLINLIDSPGHVDFSSEVTAALRVTDGALVVVDCVEGVCVQTKTVLRQALQERIRPVLFLNKVDRVFLELNKSAEECYQGFLRTIESVNVVCSTYVSDEEKMGKVELRPESGNVGFGSGLQAWGFTLKTFARMYASKFGLSEEKMMVRLWGDHFWDPAKKAWVADSQGDTLPRGFCQFVLHPIRVLFASIMANDTSVYEPLLSLLGVKVNPKQLRQLSEKQRIKPIMSEWLPAGDTLLDMIVDHLPSPVDAQQYRTEKLYSGDLTSKCANGISECDAEGALSMFVSKMVPNADKSRFVAFGRVFSGTLRVGQEVNVLENGRRMRKKVQGLVLMMAKSVEPIESCPAGSVCGVVGIDSVMSKCGTLTDCPEMAPMRNMSFSVAPVVQVAVEPSSAKDLPKLVEGLRRLSQSETLVKVYQNNVGQQIVAGVGELHLEVCLSQLQDEFMKGVSIVVHDPIVTFSETVTGRASACAKSPNRLNRLYVEVDALNEATVQALSGDGRATGDGDEKKITIADTELRDGKALGQRLVEECGWEDMNMARKVWSFGCPPDARCNALVDMTKGVAYMHETRDHIVRAFRIGTQAGVLCGEPLRGVRMQITDAKLHPDAVHRGAGQLVPAGRRALCAGQLGGEPRIMEPVFLVDVTLPSEQTSAVFQAFSQRRGEVQDLQPRLGTPLVNLSAHLPVAESFGFAAALRKATKGQAFPQMSFSHWQLMPGDPFQEQSLAHKVVCDARSRKGMPEKLPQYSDFHDKV